jgi:hypothetical protein
MVSYEHIASYGCYGYIVAMVSYEGRYSYVV